MHNKYIFVQTDDGIMIIDQHIAHERILYERALDAMERAAVDRSQRLMFPVTVQLTAAERAIYRELEDDLQRLGYESRLASDGATVELLAVPVEIRAGSGQPRSVKFWSSTQSIKRSVQHQHVITWRHRSDAVPQSKLATP